MILFETSLISVNLKKCNNYRVKFKKNAVAKKYIYSFCSSIKNLLNLQKLLSILR